MRQIVRQVKITGTGSYTPSQVITNEELEQRVATNAEWVHRTLGIRERRIAAPDEATSDLAAASGLAAIENAGVQKEDIDLIVVATATPDRLAPSTACIVQDKIGAYNSVAFDLAAVCSGFQFGMSVAAQFIASHVYDNVLLIGADTFSRITDWSRRDCVFFGDGAGAVVMSHADEADHGFLASRLYSDGRGRECFTIPGGGSEVPASEESVAQGRHYFQMQGRAVYDTATTVLPKAIREVLFDTGLTVDDVDIMVPHQPSIGILKETARRVGLPFAKVATNMERYANTSGGTIPILLDEVHRAGRLRRGDVVLFAAVGSGWTWGASLLRWA